MIVVTGSQDGAASQLRGPTFTGDVWAHPVLPATNGVLVNDITFTPGARTFWHSHENGQLLQVTSGVGFVCAEGQDPIVVRAGDTIWTPPGERHWHGATPDTVMAHTAISLGETRWNDAVTETEYHRPSQKDE